MSEAERLEKLRGIREWILRVVEHDGLAAACKAAEDFDALFPELAKPWGISWMAGPNGTGEVSYP